MGKNSTSDPKAYHEVLMPAMDALIGDPGILEPEADSKKKAEILVIPSHYIERARELRAEVSSRGDACKDILHACRKILAEIHYRGQYIAPNGMEIQFIDAEKYSGEARKQTTSYLTIAAAEHYMEHEIRDGHHLAIMSGDNSMCALAYGHHIDVAVINPDVYLGRRKVILPDRLLPKWFKYNEVSIKQFANMFPNEPPLRVNEFVEFVPAQDVEDYDFTYYIGRVEPNAEGRPDALRAIHHFRAVTDYIYPKSAGQAMFLEALLAPDIPIVVCSGIYGTGKTYVATATAYIMTAMKKQYERILTVPSEGTIGRDIGALPGEKEAKLAPLIAPFKDNLYNFFRHSGNKLKGPSRIQPEDIPEGEEGEQKPQQHNGKKRNRGPQNLSVSHLNAMVREAMDKFVEVEGMAFIGGRSISNSFIIYDEAQALERYQIKQLMTRVGDASKVVVMGDPQQIYNPHMNATSNGLSYAATKLADDPYAIVVTMDAEEIVRSVAVLEIAKRFT